MQGRMGGKEMLQKSAVFGGKNEKEAGMSNSFISKLERRGMMEEAVLSKHHCEEESDRGTALSEK